MGFCGGCGEIIGRTGRCTACNSGTGAVNPVSGINDPAMAKDFDYDGHTLAAPFERRGSINNVWSTKAAVAGRQVTIRRLDRRRGGTRRTATVQAVA